ncbi:MAG TPA: formylglycine-generating enzyme family protein [Nitrospinota bacterium]|nr:formylglycine-generating enzyme family protein [Nitrospinota bacterium]
MTKSLKALIFSIIFAPLLFISYDGEPESSKDGYKEPITGMEFVFVKGGCFEMGDTFGDGDSDERPVHTVCLDDFYMGKYEVTQGQWEILMDSNPSYFKLGDDYPVDNVSWNDALEFIKKLNHKTGKAYRLPREAQWEYAARSRGKRDKWPGTSSESELEEYVWYDKNSGERTHPVGQKRPNNLGLYDMGGNVWEWCFDWYHKDYYSKSPKKNPEGLDKGLFKGLRGGSMMFKSHFARASARTGFIPSSPHNYFFGFRLAHSGDSFLSFAKKSKCLKRDKSGI